MLNGLFQLKGKTFPILLNERQIIRSTRQEESQKNSAIANQELPPLLFAGILLEGGIISYDTNIITGGFGAKYFGAGGSNQYRQDRITIQVVSGRLQLDLL